MLGGVVLYYHGIQKTNSLVFKLSLSQVDPTWVSMEVSN